MSKQEFEDAFKRWAFFPKTKIKYTTLRKLRSLKTRQIGQKSWKEWFEYLTRNITLSPTLHERVQEGTAKTLLPKWMRNYADNLPYIRYGDGVQLKIPENYHQQTFADLVEPTPILEIDPEFTNPKYNDAPIEEYKDMKVKYPPKSTAIIVGRGPSLFKNKHPEMLAESNYKGLIVSSDGGMIPLLEAGVVPQVVVCVDGSEVITKWFNHPLVRKHGSKMKLILTVTANHKVYQTAKQAGMKIYWFHPMFDDWRENESWTRLQCLLSATEKYPKGAPRAMAGANSGAFAWIAAMAIFKRSPIALIGIDFGYPEGTKLEDTQYYSSVLRYAKGDVSIIKKAYKEFYHPTFKQKAFCDLVFYHYRQAFLEMQQEVPIWYKHYGGTINCTEGGTLFGQGIKCMKFKEFLTRNPK